MDESDIVTIDEFCEEIENIDENLKVELKKIEEKTNAKFEALQSKEVTQTINQKRTRILLKQNAKGALQYELVIEDYDKSNDQMIKELIDLKKRVESAIIQEE